MRQIYMKTLMVKCKFNKIAYNFIEITPRHGCSPVNLLHIFRTHFTKNTCFHKSFWKAISFSPFSRTFTYALYNCRLELAVNLFQWNTNIQSIVIQHPTLRNFCNRLYRIFNSYILRARISPPILLPCLIKNTPKTDWHYYG